MGLSLSPKIVTDGLQFYYDSSNTQKSWLGKPTSNLIVTTPYSAGAYAYATGPVTTSGVMTSTIMPPKTDVVRYTITSAVNTARGVYYISGLTTAVSYTFSCVWKYNGTNTINPTFLADAVKGNPESGANDNTFTSVAQTNTILDNGWVYSVYTWVYATCPTGASKFTFGIQTGSDAVYVGNTFDVYNMQLEVNNFGSPYVAGTRSTTQAIKDIIGNTVTTTADLVYNSDNTFSFNNKIGFTSTLTGSASQDQYTRIAWMSPSSVSTAAAFKTAWCNGVGNNADMSICINNGGYPTFHQYTSTLDYSLSSPTAITANTKVMIAVTVDRSTSTNNVKLYVNGQLVATGSIAIGASASDTMYFGGTLVDGYTGGRMFSGNIYAGMHYNRVLSAAEIAQNFNALRGRYGV